MAGGRRWRSRCLAVGVLAAVDDGPTAATAQAPTTVPGRRAPRRRRPHDHRRRRRRRSSGTPDTVTVSLGVQVDRADRRRRRWQTASTKANALIDTLTAPGVAKADIQTGYVSLWPRTDDDGKTIDGYSASATRSPPSSTTWPRPGRSSTPPPTPSATASRLGGVSFSIDDTSGLLRARPARWRWSEAKTAGRRSWPRRPVCRSAPSLSMRRVGPASCPPPIAYAAQPAAPRPRPDQRRPPIEPGTPGRCSSRAGRLRAGVLRDARPARQGGSVSG